MSKTAAKNSKKTQQFAQFVAGTDYGIRRTANKDWYVRLKTKRGVEWIKADKTDVKNYLEAVHKIADYSEDGLMSDADYAMLDAFFKPVEFAGAYAGYREPGEIAVEDSTVLITRGVKLIEPAPGNCEFCKNAFIKQFPTEHQETLTVDEHENVVRDIDGNVVKYADLSSAKEMTAGGKKIEEDDKGNLSGKAFTITQRDAILGWCQGALRTLHEATPGKWRHGQALLMIGLSGSGKTSLQNIITAMLTGRATDPELFFKDKTSFNEQMGEKEHWLMSDPKTTNRASQEKFLGDIKNFVANVWMPIHPKGGKQVNLKTFRRMTVALNPDNKALEILRDMADSDFDKVMILDFKNAGKWSPDGEAFGGFSWEDWEAKMLSELPAFIHWLLNEYRVPEHMWHKRYNVVYHNPQMEPQFAAATFAEIQTELLEIVGIGVFTNIESATDGVLDETGPLTIGEIIDRTTHPRSSTAGRAKKHPDYFHNTNHTKLGNLLVKWSDPALRCAVSRRSPQIAPN